MAPESGVPGRRATGADVARLAGVSRATVSYVLNETPHQTIPEHTRTRVREAAEQLQYRPSPMARALRAGRTDVVLGIMPDPPSSPELWALHRELALGLSDAGLVFVLHPYSRLGQPLQDVCRKLTPASVLWFGTPSSEERAAVRSSGIDVLVTVGAAGGGGGPQDFTFEDPTVGALQARHLVSLGRRLITVVLPEDPRMSELVGTRARSVADELRRSGAGSCEVTHLGAHPSAAEELVARWQQAGPGRRGVAAWNDELAVAIHAAAVRSSSTISDDIVLVGAYPELTVRSQLTTVRVDLHQRAAQIMEGLGARFVSGRSAAHGTASAGSAVVAKPPN